MILPQDKYPKIMPSDMEELVFNTLLELKDVHFPKVSMFSAPIHYLVLGLIIAILSYFIKKKFLCYQGRVGRAKKRALKKLDKLVKKHQNDDAIASFASEISILLKRIAIVSFGKDKVATLYGENWSRFILEKAKVKPNSELLFLITAASFMNPKKDIKTTGYITELNAFVKEWINDL